MEHNSGNPNTSNPKNVLGKLQLGGDLSGSTAFLNFGTPTIGGGCNAGTGICNVSKAACSGLSVPVSIFVLSQTPITIPAGNPVTFNSSIAISLNSAAIQLLTTVYNNNGIYPTGSSNQYISASFMAGMFVNVQTTPQQMFMVQLSFNSGDNEIANELWPGCTSAQYITPDLISGMPNMNGSTLSDFVIILRNVQVVMPSATMPSMANNTVPGFVTLGANNNGSYAESNSENAQSQYTGNILCITQYPVNGMSFPVNISAVCASQTVAPTPPAQIAAVIVLDFDTVSLNGNPPQGPNPTGGILQCVNSPYNYWNSLFNAQTATEYFSSLNWGGLLPIGSVPIQGVTYPPSGDPADTLLNSLFYSLTENLTSITLSSFPSTINTSSGQPWYMAPMIGTYISGQISNNILDCVVTLPIILNYNNN